jgi:Zn-dependent protease
VVLAKLKTVGALLLTAFKFLKLGKFAWTFSTMGATILLYAQRYGFPYAAGLVGLIFVHELGHGFAARMMGMPVGPPVFIPFVGAFIALKEQPKSAWQEAIIGAGGPFFGLLGGLAVLSLSRMGIARELMLGLAYSTGLINIFNLIPFLGLDGDRITRGLDGLQLVFTAAFVASVAVLQGGLGERAGPMLLIIAALLAMKGIYRHYKRAPSPVSLIDTEQRAYRAMGLYLLIAGGLAAVVSVSSHTLGH